MSFEPRLRHHLAGRDAQWRDPLPGTTAVASWRDAEPHILLACEGPLRASLVVDAYTLARLEGARATIAHEGAASDTASRAASRFGVSLLDASTLPEPSAPETPIVELIEAAVSPMPALEPAVPSLSQPLLAITVWTGALTASADFGDALPAPEPVPLLVAHVEPEVEPTFLDLPDVAREAPFAPAAPYEALGDLALEALTALPEPEPAPMPVAIEEAPVVIQVEAPAILEVAPEMPAEAPVEIPAPEPSLPDVFPALPWATPAPAEAVAFASVAPEEVAAMPWNRAPPLPLPTIAPVAPAPAPEPEFEMMPGAPRRIRPVDHPTLAPQQPGWGLPWPRPLAPSDGLSIHDPKLWNAKDRVHAMHEELEKTGGGSFGAVKPDGSGWLKRLQFGP